METSHFNMWDNADCYEMNKNENRDIFAKSTQTRMTKIKLSVFNYCHWSWKPELYNDKNWIKRLIWGWLLTALRAPNRSLGMTSVDGVSRHRQASPALLPLVLKSLFFHSFQLFVSLPGAAAVNLARPHSPEPPPLTVGGSSHSSDSSSTVLSLPPVASTPALPTLSPSVK